MAGVMIWRGDSAHRFAPALDTLLSQLQAAWPGPQWQSSPQTGTIGDAAHQAESSSDHNPWLNNTVRALDVAVNVSGVPGIVDVSDGPPGGVLFAMVNHLYAARDPRVWPNGYAIFDGRITDWDHPGLTNPYDGADQHHYHVHISASQDPAGYNSTAPWPLPGSETTSGGGVKVTPAQLTGGRMFRIIRNVTTGAVRLAMPGVWASLEGATVDQTKANVEYFRKDPLCVGNRVDDVSNDGMQLIYNVYMKGHA